MSATSTVVVSKEMFDLFSTVLYLSRFFCLQPLKWIKTDYSYIISKSGPYMTYSILASLSLVTASIYGLTQAYRMEAIYLIRLNGNTKRFVTLSDVVVVIFPCIIGVAVTSYKIDNSLKYFNYLRQFDCYLQKQPRKTRKSFLVPFVTILFTVFILIFDAMMWLKLIARSQSIFILTLPYYVCYCFTMIIEIIYWQFVHSIKIRLVLLNEKLAQFCRNDHLIVRIDRKKINSVVDTLNVETLKKHDPQTNDQIRDLINAYQKLTEAANLVNDAFGLLILIVITGCLVHLLVTPYSLYVIVLTTGNTMFIITQSIWMTGHVLRLLLIVEPCHGCILAAKTTSQLVCKLLCLDLDKEVKKSLEFFMAYLAECQIKFTAYGFTKLHRGLLTTITGAVTTYLVILFQFNQ
ncbi:gustatory receptor for sugar taste 43a-like [Tribolium madens]|uniref:gustatory receptor for sugar taste 43a-like n=1 Tax=Tribolium madens TaxID=41895 RepID=UPI001CF75497|nr:gustatory receptor for sugar taste 43a-like [Tribolium madens]